MLRLRESATHLLVSGKGADLDLIDEWFAFQSPGYFYAPSYQRWRVSHGEEGWDGWIHPMQRLTHDVGRLLRGYRFELLSLLESHDLRYNTDKLLPSPFNLDAGDVPTNIIEASFELDTHQREGIAYWLNHAIGISRVTVSGGKCLGYGTPVMLADGTTVAVQRVKVGDKLMGPDSKPRKVMALGRGRGLLYRVAQDEGDVYVCNSEHILRLEYTAYNQHKTGEQINLPVSDFVQLAPDHKRALHGVKATSIQFKKKAVPLDPYFIGLWLGDGSRHKPAVTVADTDVEILTYLEDFAFGYGLTVKKEAGRGCGTYYLSGTKSGPRNKRNSVSRGLRELGLLRGIKRVPDVYRFNNDKVRAEVLAGLLDSDGSRKRKGQIEITLMDRKLAEDVLWLARSLGFSARIHPKRVTLKSRNYVAVGWRVGLTGSFSTIPCLLPRKQVGDCLRGVGRCAIKVQALGVGNYYGFELDGDGLFLLGDFTVTHNTAMFAGAAALIKEKFPEARILYVTQAERLVRQCTREMKKFLPHLDVGQYGGGVTTGKAAKDICVCTIAMLHKHFHSLKEHWFDTFMALFYDEVHHCASKTSKKVVLQIPAYFRLGASDTIKADDIRKNNDIHGLFGPLIIDVKAAPLIEKGRIARPYIYIVDELAWNNKFRCVGYSPVAKSNAFVLIDSVWRKGTYIGPVYELNEDGTVKTKLVKGTQKVEEEGVPEENWDWEMLEQPIIVQGLHRIMLEGTEMEVDARWVLLDRITDRCIVQFKERNERIVEWVKHFSERGLPTLVVCTRTLHVLILESLIQTVVDPDNVKILFGEDSPTQRDAAFEWFRESSGGVLITPLVKEGVSINEIRAGVIADYIADWEVANQVVGRFIRAKEEDNVAEIVWFLDRQHPTLRSGSEGMLLRMRGIDGYRMGYRNRPSDKPRMLLTGKPKRPVPSLT